jgi:hypothetical protein
LVHNAFFAKRQLERKINELFLTLPTTAVLPMGYFGEFQVLRRWASYTTADLLRPLGVAAEPDPAGGGYFLRWENVGIVIDPGKGFGRAFREAGLVPNDIAFVVVTHYHLDHMGELLDLITWAFERAEDNRKPFRKVTFILATSVMEAFAKLLEPLNNREVEVYTLHRGQDRIYPVGGGSKQIRLKGIPVSHKDLSGSREKGFGLRIELMNGDHVLCRVGITSDTRLDDANTSEALAQEFGDLDLAVAHIGSLYPWDIGQPTRTRQHLGFAGTLELLRRFSNRSEVPAGTPGPLLLVSEWGEELSAGRTRICQVLQESLNPTEARVFPAAYHQRVALKESQADPLCAFHRDVVATDWSDVGGIKYTCQDHH